MNEREFRQAVYDILKDLVDGSPWTAERESASMKLYQMKRWLEVDEDE